MDDASHGFDEHNGVNQIWRGMRQCWDIPSGVIDIDPRYSDMRCVNPAQDLVGQRFVWRDGSLVQVGCGWWGRRIVRQCVYLHFQKRMMKVVGDFAHASCFEIVSDGFTILGDGKAGDLQEIAVRRRGAGWRMRVGRLRDLLRYLVWGRP